MAPFPAGGGKKSDVKETSPWIYPSSWSSTARRGRAAADAGVAAAAELRDFELVVADDGSDEDFFPLTRKILAENGFTGAKFVKLTPNGARSKTF